jgi:hypothetical protein
MFSSSRRAGPILVLDLAISGNNQKNPASEGQAKSDE